MKYCEFCDKELNDNARFCDRCGEEVKDDFLNESKITSDESELNQLEKNLNINNNKKKRKLIIVGIILFIILFSILLSYFFIYGVSEEEKRALEIVRYLSDNLKDPSSLYIDEIGIAYFEMEEPDGQRIGDPIKSEGTFYRIIYNAKNSYGGYGGSNIFYMIEESPETIFDKKYYFTSDFDFDFGFKTINYLEETDNYLYQIERLTYLENREEALNIAMRGLSVQAIENIMLMGNDPTYHIELIKEPIFLTEKQIDKILKKL